MKLSQPVTSGFARPGAAAAAARKGHALGRPYCREWDSDQAKAAVRRRTWRPVRSVPPEQQPLELKDVAS